jgi:hypothetical protein
MIEVSWRFTSPEDRSAELAECLQRSCDIARHLQEAK